jgi:hypothetical protein
VVDTELNQNKKTRWSLPAQFFHFTPPASLTLELRFPCIPFILPATWLPTPAVRLSTAESNVFDFGARAPLSLSFWKITLTYMLIFPLEPGTGDHHTFWVYVWLQGDLTAVQTVSKWDGKDAAVQLEDEFDLSEL